MNTQIKPDYYVKNIDGSYSVASLKANIPYDEYWKERYKIERGEIEVLERMIDDASMQVLYLRNTMLDGSNYVKEAIDKITAENEELLTSNGHLHHDYHHITRLVKDLLEAVDKISPDVEGYFEPINEELCELRDWVKR